MLAVVSYQTLTVYGCCIYCRFAILHLLGLTIERTKNRKKDGVWGNGIDWLVDTFRS